MAKKDDTPPQKKKMGTQIVTWGFVALLIAGLASFDISPFAGSITTIGSVGKQEVSADEYARAVENALNSLSQQAQAPISFTQAREFGIDRNVLESLFNQAALDGENVRVGISASDADVASEIQKISVFLGPDGKFDRETYRFVLEQNNITEASFEAGLRKTLARDMLASIIQTGYTSPETLTQILYDWAGETRDFSVLLLQKDILDQTVDEPSDDQLMSYYDDHKDQFMAPEMRKITYAGLFPEDNASADAINDQALRELYQTRIDEYVIAPSLLVERLVYPNQNDARSAKLRLDNNTITFEELVFERGLALEDVDMGIVTRDDFTNNVADALFSVTLPGIIGPLDTELGPALFRVNAILDAQETTLDEVRPELSQVLAEESGRRNIINRIEIINDLLIGGASLADLSKEQDMVLETINFIPDSFSNGRLSDSVAFQNAVMALNVGDFPQTVSLEDGSFVVVELEAIIPPAPMPFADVKDDIRALLMAEDAEKALVANADEIKRAVQSGQALESFGEVTTQKGFARSDISNTLPREFSPILFAMQTPGKLELVKGDGVIAIVRLDQIIEAPQTGNRADNEKAALMGALSQSIAADALSLYNTALISRAGIDVDVNAINTINNSFDVRR